MIEAIYIQAINGKAHTEKESASCGLYCLNESMCLDTQRDHLVGLEKKESQVDVVTQLKIIYY